MIKKFLILLTLTTLASLVHAADTNSASLADEFEELEFDQDAFAQTMVEKFLVENSSRRKATGTITLDDVTYEATLFFRRDMMSQALTALSGQPSYYKLVAPKVYNKGVAVSAEPLRGRLQSHFDTNLNVVVFKFFEPKTDHSYKVDAEAGTEFYVVHIPVYDLGLSSDQQHVAIETAIERSDSDVLPAIDQARFYAANTCSSIKLNLTFAYVSYDEVSETPSRIASNVVGAAGYLASTVNSGFWSAWNYVSTNGVVPTLKVGLEIVGKVSDVVDGVSDAATAYQQGTVLEGVKALVSEQGVKKVEAFTKNIGDLTTIGVAIADATHKTTNEISSSEAKDQRDSALKAVKALENDKSSREEENNVLQQMLAEDDIAKDKISDTERVIESNAVAIEGLIKRLKVAKKELEIAELEVAFHDTLDEELKDSLLRKIDARKKALKHM